MSGSRDFHAHLDLGLHELYIYRTLLGSWFQASTPQNPKEPGAKQGKNGFDQIGFGGPCPPEGTHRYFFKLFALDQSLNLAAGATKEELLKAIDGHILDAAEFMGRYTRQTSLRS